MKKKWLWINLSVGLNLFIICGLITALLIALPIKLTEEETNYYTETAKNVWYNGLQSVSYDDDIVIKYSLKDKTVSVFDKDTNKQSITVNFSSNNDKVTINKPLTSFIACFLFYGFLWTILITFFTSIIVYKFQHSKDQILEKSQE